MLAWKLMQEINISLKKENVINLSFVQKTDLSINFKDITSELRNV